MRIEKACDRSGSGLMTDGAVAVIVPSVGYW